MRAPLRVALLCSRRAPGLAHLLERDPRRGSRYELAVCVTSEEELPPEAVHALVRGIPFLQHPLRAYHRWLRAPLSDPDARAVHDADLADLLEPYAPDLVLLAGYLYLLTEPMLDRYPGRMVNVHHADLTLRGRDGGPRYPGLRAVRDALLAGEVETRATAHVVTERLDDGPLLLRSWPFPTGPVTRAARTLGAADMLKSCVWAHQEWMLRTAWGPLLAASLELLATARVQVAGGAAWIDGRRGPLDVEPDGELPDVRRAVALAG